MKEVEASPLDLSEWIDVAILALDGAWRAGYSPEEIALALVTKQARNEARAWTDWRTQPADKAIEHDRISLCRCGDQWCKACMGALRAPERETEIKPE